MFDTFEFSRFAGRPFHLFIFRRQMVSVRLASTGPGHDILIGEHTYVGAQIERSAIQQTVERAKDKIKIKFPHLLDVAGAVARGETLPVTQGLGGWWRPYIPSDDIHVTCMAAHHGQIEPPKIEWMGWAVQPEFSDLELVLTCDPNSPAAESRNQGAKWQKGGCYKAVYSTGIRGCNLDPVPLTVVGALTDVDGLTLTAAEFAGSVFPLTGGTLYWTRTDGIEEERPIMAHSGTSVQILWGGAELAPGLSVSARPNCPGTWAACEERDNTINAGIAMFKPVKDPTSGVSMSWG
jgi:hypothetical protein